MGGNLCNASPAADSVPGMVAAASTVTIVGPDGEREVAVENFCRSPGETTLSRGEMVAFINIPAPEPRSGDAYLRFIPRTEMDIAVVGAGVNVTLDEAGVITSARVALGAVAQGQHPVARDGHVLGERHLEGVPDLVARCAAGTKERDGLIAAGNDRL